MSEGLRRIHIIFVVLTSLWGAGFAIAASVELWAAVQAKPAPDPAADEWDDVGSPVGLAGTLEEIRAADATDRLLQDLAYKGHLEEAGGLAVGAVVPPALYWVLVWVIAGFRQDRQIRRQKDK